MARSVSGKPEVYNPVLSLRTVGQELEEAFAAQNKNTALLGISNLSTKTKLSDKQMQKACKLLGVDDFFIGVLKSIQKEYQEKEPKYKASYKEALQNFRKFKKVLPLLRDEFEGGYDRLDDIIDFFGVDSEREILPHIQRSIALYRSQKQSDVDDINLSAWLRRGELDYEKIKPVLPQYDRSGLENWIKQGDWQKKLTSVSYFKSIPTLLQKYGVSVILLPYLNKTVYGAVKWMDGHPVIMISDREQDLATCWFTLFHELGHVLLHENQLSVDETINKVLPKGKSAQREREANKFANKYLFGGDELRKYIFELKRKNDYVPQEEIAERFGVAPIFVGYWMRKAQYYPSQHRRIPISFE